MALVGVERDLSPADLRAVRTGIGAALRTLVFRRIARGNPRPDGRGSIAARSATKPARSKGPRQHVVVTSMFRPTMDISEIVLVWPILLILKWQHWVL
jgi:hypothetical protein